MFLHSFTIISQDEQSEQQAGSPDNNAVLIGFV